MNLPPVQNPKAVWMSALVVGILTALIFLLGTTEMIVVIFFSCIGAAVAYGLQLPEVRRGIKNFWDNR